MRRGLLGLLLTLWCGATLPAATPGGHPVLVNWVRHPFVPSFQPPDTDSRWDIPAEANPNHGQLPVNLRSGLLGGSIDLGLARRQYEIEEPFVLVLGLWQPNAGTPRLASLAAFQLTPEQWRALWAPVTYADLLRLEDIVLDPGRSIEETRRLVLQMKKAPPFSESKIQMAPVIDPVQRQLRCSIRADDALRLLAPDSPAAPPPALTLWGVAYPDGTPAPAPAK